MFYFCCGYIIPARRASVVAVFNIYSAKFQKNQGINDNNFYVWKVSTACAPPQVEIHFQNSWTFKITYLTPKSQCRSQEFPQTNHTFSCRSFFEKNEAQVLYIMSCSFKINPVLWCMFTFTCRVDVCNVWLTVLVYWKIWVIATIYRIQLQLGILKLVQAK